MALPDFSVGAYGTNHIPQHFIVDGWSKQVNMRHFPIRGLCDVVFFGIDRGENYPIHKLGPKGVIVSRHQRQRFSRELLGANNKESLFKP